MSADKVNGHAVAPPAVPGTVTITEAQPARKARKRKKHVPVAPAGSVPSGEVEWKATLRCVGDCPTHAAHTLRLNSQTWFEARAKAVAFFACEPGQLNVRRA